MNKVAIIIKERGSLLSLTGGGSVCFEVNLSNNNIERGSPLSLTGGEILVLVK